MTRIAAAAVLFLGIWAGAVQAQDAAPATITLDEAMTGATAMAPLGTGYLFVAKPDSAWVCAINMNPNHFVALVQDDVVVAEQTMPGAFCVAASQFKDLME